MRTSLTIFLTCLYSFVASGAADPAPAPAGGASPLRACARIRGLEPPLDVASSLRSLSAGERRARLAARLRADLAARSGAVVAGLRGEEVRDLRLLWGAGLVCAAASPEAWARISRLPEVAVVFEDPPREEHELADQAASDGPNPAVPPEGPLIALRVPEAWARGFTGRGVVVALQDTGVDMSHPDLAGHLWTNTGEIPGNAIDDDGNGYVDDVHGFDFADRDGDPSDAAGHGTNAAGLIVGDGSDGRQTGAAPGARLMVLRRGTTQALLWEASDYAIAMGADVLSQSVSWKWSFLPRPDYSAWRRQAETELAAGMIHLNSAGNTGEQLATEPIPYNVATPANCPPPWLPLEQTLVGGVSSVLGIGNVDARTHVLAPSSPFGPAEWTDIAGQRDASYPHAMPAEYRDYPAWGGAIGLLKPDLVAPGENSLSTAPGGGYESFGGTSAATPRVAGILALMLEAVPGASPAELARALAVTARDLGPLGRDARHGAGLPQADLAIDAVGPPLALDAVALVDEGAPRGDGDGGADAGEIVRLEVTLRSTGVTVLDEVELALGAVSDAIARDAFDAIGPLAAGASGVGSFRVEFPAGSCARTAELSLEVRQEERARTLPLFVAIGTESRSTLLDDDFEADRGMGISGGASSGAFVRALPVGTTKNGQPMNPAADATPAPGAVAYITGNGPTDPDAADVDGGTTILTSPARDARGFVRVELSYARWFSSLDIEAQDRLRVEATGDGAAWSPIEEISATEAAWRTRSIVLSDLLSPGEGTRVRFSVEDADDDDTIEGGIDDLRLVGVGLACSEFAIGGPAPGAVGATLRLSRTGVAHLGLAWDPPSAAGGNDPAKGYRVTRSAGPAGGFVEIGRPVSASFTEIDGFGGTPGSAAYYLVESLP